MKAKAFKNKAAQGFAILLVGGFTGAFAGVVVTCYTALLELAEEFSREYYGFFRDRPAFIPLLFLALGLGAVVVGGLVKAMPMIRGSGFPQTEGATLGLVRYKWYEILPGMFAASLLCVFMGLSAGAEGPALMIGGACGYGVSDVTRRKPVMRRYAITGGACAGLAVALNAPLTGIVFAYEEAYKRFTPEVFSCSFSSVVIAIVIRSVLGPLVNLSTGPVFRTFVLAETGISFLPYVLLASLLVGLCGVAFYYLTLAARRLFHRIRPKRFVYVLRMLPPFLLAGVAGLLCADAMGAGLHFIRSLGAGEVSPLFSSPVWATLLIVVALRYAVTVVNLGADMPCCVSFPMFAIGAGMGALFSLLFTQMGMEESAAGVLIVICMVTFFTTVVKAPFTGIIMAVELTWSFTPLLPVVLAIAVGYLIGQIFHTEPLYEKLLEEILEEDREHATRIRAKVKVTAGAGRAVRDVTWPYTAVATLVEREGGSFAPKGDSVLLAGDLVTVEGTPTDVKEFRETLTSAVGELIEEAPSEEGTNEKEPPPQEE